jgi:Protein of unknown function (DUF3052).
MSSLGFDEGSIVQEFGYDDDVAEEVRSAIERSTGEELVDEDYDDIADGAIAWWRSEDGNADDLADLFLDMKANLESESALCWLLVPGPREPGHVSASVIEEAAETAGLMATTNVAASEKWTGIRLTATGARR